MAKLQESLKSDAGKHLLAGPGGWGGGAFPWEIGHLPLLSPWAPGVHFNTAIRWLLKKRDSEHVNSLAPHWVRSDRKTPSVAGKAWPGVC